MTCFKTEAIQDKLHGAEFRIKVNPDDPGMAQIFANYPAAYLSTGMGLAEEVKDDCTTLKLKKAKDH